MVSVSVAVRRVRRVGNEKEKQKEQEKRWMSNDFKEGKARKEVNLGRVLGPL